MIMGAMMPLGGPPSGPANLAALPAWWSAKDVNLLGNVGIANNDPIGTWKNKGAGGATYDVVQAVAGAKPLFKSSYSDGLPAVLFDATDDILTAASSPVALQAARHVFFVAVWPATWAGFVLVTRGANAGAYNLGSGNNTTTMVTNGAGTSSGVPAIATGAKVIVEIGFDGVITNLPTVSINGVAQTVSQLVGLGVGAEVAAAGLRVGDVFGEGIKEILYYDSLQSAGNVAATYAYLAGQWP